MTTYVPTLPPEASDRATETVVITTIDTPMGLFGAALSSRGLGRLTFPDEPFESCSLWALRAAPGARVVNASPALETLKEELVAYLDGDLTGFSVPLDMRGTPFQLRVWEALMEIGYGETRSYRWVAERTGNRAAVRAVGLANGRNPVPVIVPCHRVIGSNGTLTGYGGGLPLKERLLQLEGIDFRRPAVGTQTPLW
ncbi:MAG: methylated-DNA--[protein]-cysteine S-methyltransferase [Chloroflexota bacterium]